LNGASHRHPSNIKILCAELRSPDGAERKVASSDSKLARGCGETDRDPQEEERYTQALRPALESCHAALVLTKGFENLEACLYDFVRVADSY